MQESLVNEKKQSAEQTRKLTEDIEVLKRDKEIKAKEYSVKITRANKLVEQYKKMTDNVAGKYIDSKAKQFGVSSTEIKSRLGEKYTLEDVDKLVENLQSYKVAMNKLPIALQENKGRMRVTESKESLVKDKTLDDTVDESLLRLVDIL